MLLDELGLDVVDRDQPPERDPDVSVVEWVEASNGGRRLYGFTGTASKSSSPRWACADARRFTNDEKQSTRLQVTNVDASPAQITLTLYQAKTGTAKLTRTFTLEPNRQLVISLAKPAYEALGNKYRGLALVESTNNQKIVVDAFTAFADDSMTAYACADLP